MISFIARRLLSLLFIALAIIFFTYLGMHMIDNWQAPQAPPPFPSASPPVVDEPGGYRLAANTRAAAADTVAYIGLLLRGDLGTAATRGGEQPIGPFLLESYRNSAGLMAMALAAATILGLLFGALAALSRRSAPQYALLLGTIVGISAPSFLIALLLQQGGIMVTRASGTRLVSMGGFAWDFEHLAMPLIVLAARPVAYLTRASFLALGRIMAEDYIRTAYAKGLSRFRVVLTHALKNFAVPFLTSVGVSLRFSLSILPLVEFIFGWPGLGLAILDAIQSRVPILVVTIALALGVTIQLITLLLDLFYTLVDPRIGART